MDSTNLLSPDDLSCGPLVEFSHRTLVREGLHDGEQIRNVKKDTDGDNAPLDGAENPLRDISALSFEKASRVSESESADDVVAVVFGQGVGGDWLAEGFIQLRVHNTGKLLDSRTVIGERYG